MERRLVVHVHVDCRDAMGANLVNTVAEAVADRLAELGGGRSGCASCPTCATAACVRVRARVPARGAGHRRAWTAAGSRDGIVAASRFAEAIPTAPPPTTRGS